MHSLVPTLLSAEDYFCVSHMLWLYEFYWSDISFCMMLVLIFAHTRNVINSYESLVIYHFLMSGFGGLVVSVLASGTQDHGFEHSRSRWIFGVKTSTACLPSEGKKSRLSHVADLRHVKEPCDVRGSQNCRPN
jgi:hypothetical protein